MRTLLLFLLPSLLIAQPKAQHDLIFSEIPVKWHEGLPLGNGLLGCIAWQKDGKLRLALDRSDLWDSRPMNGLDRPEFTYQWVAQQVAKKEYGLVQEYFDAPYEREAGPTKLPGGALEFDIGNWKTAGSGSVQLDISTGLSTIQWVDGQRFETFIHANKEEGWFRCTGFPAPAVCLKLLSPQYSSPRESSDANSVQGSDLARLGYPQSEALMQSGVWVFHQPGWGGFSYDIAVSTRQVNDNVWEGVWSISSHFPGKKSVNRAETTVKKALRRGFDKSFAASKEWWNSYWSKSSVSLPDSAIERQYYLDLYKFGCVARENKPMISLQAVWTADNGRLPPWKGDLHHDLNTQLSYWPAYTANHLSEGLSYLQHLERNDAAHRAYTQRYFGTTGLNIPGVSTLQGAEMGGWIQYACSPTTAAWCAQHFYLQWRYSQDRQFLKHHAWPFLRDAATHLEELTRPPLSVSSQSLSSSHPDSSLTRQPSAENQKPSTVGRQPSAVHRRPSTVSRQPSAIHRRPSTVSRQPSAIHRKPSTVGRKPSAVNRLLPLSSSPEINDNSIKAWFPNSWSNYDLALTRYVFEKTAELAGVLNMPANQEKWQKALKELPDFALEPNGALMFSPTLPYRESHRHFSHLMAIHPLGLLDWDQASARPTIVQSLQLLDSIGASAWCGYSYAWLANLRARASDGSGARDALRIFATAFVSRNSFHLNGDQSGKGYSSYTYDPFTLEGNFAFAAGVQEMLLQSQGGILRVFPAVPSDWETISFKHLRAEGAFLVSAIAAAKQPTTVEIIAETGGLLQLRLPPGVWQLKGRNEAPTNSLWQIKTRKGERLFFVQQP